MKSLMIAVPLLVLGMTSCDKAKLAVKAAREKMGGATEPGAPADPGGNVDPGLASQVDTAAEGVRFRRDLEFPKDVKVRLINRRTFKNVRIVSKSAIGNQVMSYSGTWEDVASIDLKDGQVLLALEKSGEVLNLQKSGEIQGESGAEKAKMPSTGAGVAGSRLRFVAGSRGWRIPETKGPVEFGSMVLEQEIRPALPRLLASQGIQPRTHWFSSSRRWIGGDKFELESESMALLFPGKSEGKVVLTYEVAEALGGHPCGRFAVEGNVTLKGDVSLNGESSNTEMTIRSGKVWCSLIHPLVLREEYETVQTSEKGPGSESKVRIQGAVDQIIFREWNP